MKRYKLRKASSRQSPGFAEFIAANETSFLRLSMERRAGEIFASVGRLSNGAVPPPPIAGPKTPADVREVDISVAAWLTTGDRGRGVGIGKYRADSPSEVAVALSLLAAAIDTYAGPLLEGRYEAWQETERLMLSRGTWPPTG